MTRHPSEQVVGRIRRDGGWDRRFRYQAAPAEDVRRTVLLGVPIMLTLIVGIPWLMFALAGAPR